MNRRDFLGSTALAAMGAALPKAKRPNILLILVDDLKPALRGYADRTAISPNIDKLMRRGTRFSAAYANQAVCAPSRFNLMTGARSTSTGIYDFGVNLREVLPNAVTMPQHFLASGYHTESMGKVYHIGHGTHDDTLGWSVQHHRDHLIEYHDPASTGGVPTREEALFEEVPGAPGDPFAYARTLAKGAAWEATDLPDEAYADGRTAAYAISRFEALKGQADPFFLAVGFARPHMPFAVPRRYWELYDPAKLPMPEFEQLPKDAPPQAGKKGGEIEAYREVPVGVEGADFDPALKRKLIHGYYASVSYVDAQIGKVLDALDAQGLAKDTLVVLWGDHGFHLGDHGLWTKHTNFEQATHIPLIFAGPGVSVGKTTGQLAETVDIFPTLAALAGIAAPKGPQPIDGVSLVPVLRDPKRRVRDHAYHSYPRGDWIGQAIRTERYRLVRWTNQKTGERNWELYDLANDPQETRNIASEAADTRAHLDAILDRHPTPKRPFRRAG